MFGTLAEIVLATLKYKFFGIRTPLVLSISITSSCNLRCVYCYSKEDNLHAKDVPLTEILNTLDEFHKLGTRVVLLQGGEPLLHKNLKEIIEFVKSKKMYCAVTTNSIGFEKHLPFIKKVNQVQLSIDGNEELTDINRGKGVYASVVKAIELCSENRIPFHLHIVITKGTSVENTLIPLTELANKYGTYLNFCIPAPTGSAKDKNLADDNQIREFYKTILEKKRLGMPTNNTYRAIMDIISWGEEMVYNSYIPSDDNELKKKYPKCIMGNLVCWLDSERLLHPCAIRFGQKGFYYSIKEYGVKGAWEKLKKIPCHYCPNSTEFNNLFNFRIEPVINSLKFLIKRGK